MMTPIPTEVFRSIPPSKSDELLLSWGFDLLREYAAALQVADFDPRSAVLELACGTGRMTALLAHLGYTVLAGDLDLSRLPDLQRRVTPALAPRVGFIQLNLRALPFRDDSTASITCVNTLHEVSQPVSCLRELVRIMREDGTLLVSEFNDTGFAAMQRLHEQVYGNDHRRGTITHDEIASLLHSAFSHVQVLDTPLNRSYIARRKR
jgi:ubiquinone/menaquinone biosynthesis C-methylase UbiE